MKHFFAKLPSILLLLLCAQVPVHAQERPVPVDPAVLFEVRNLISFLGTSGHFIPFPGDIGVKGVDDFFYVPEGDDMKDQIDVIKSGMPDTGDALIKIISERDNAMRVVAINLISMVLDALTLAQIESLAHAQIASYVSGHSKYLKGTESYIGTGYIYALQVDEKNRVQTRSYKYLDGEQYGDSNHHSGMMASSGGIHLKDLDYGTHTVKTVTEYELNHNGVIIKGKAESPELTFEIVRRKASRKYATPHDRAQGKAVRNASSFIETRDVVTTQEDLSPRNSEPWKPGNTMQFKGSDNIYAGHFPFFRVSEGLPVDLSFEVEIELVDTGEILEGAPIFVRKGSMGHRRLEPKDLQSFFLSREGYVSLKATLTPKMPDSPSQNNYYNDSFESPVVRAKVYRFLEDTAPPWLTTLREEAKQFKREGEASEIAIAFVQSMASLDSFQRARAVFDCKRKLTSEEMMTALPFLIALLQDTGSDMLHTPA